jgi:restriction system protein
MAMPKWHEFMAPIMRVMADGATRDRHQIAQLAADDAGLTDADRAIVLTTGQPMFANRIGWALSHLTIAGALTRPQRGAYVINEVGKALVKNYPNVTLQDVYKHTGYRRKIVRPDAVTESVDTNALESLAPAEMIDQGLARITADVADQLLTRIHEQEPVFFEQAVLDLIMAMGYGGAEGSATRTQLVADGGIDGIVDQDALGLSRIYVQAKRYAPDNIVGRPAIQAFVGALAGNQANQGVFITTSRFSADARSYAGSVPTRIVLIDGERLTRLMIRYGVGVQVKQTIQIVEIDEDFFE